MEAAYAGIDVAFRKKKRLPVVVCCRRGHVLKPLELRSASAIPPAGEGNARTLEDSAVRKFACEAFNYLRAIEAEFGVRIRRVAIDAPSDPKRAGATRRQCEIGLDVRGINCITTPSAAEFEQKKKLALAHLRAGGLESRLPAGNQLWMLVGFALFEELRRQWECLEVFPQAIAAVLDASKVHKSQAGGLLAQLIAAARHTGWPAAPAIEALSPVGYGKRDDKLDAYLAAWVASLDEAEREAIGLPPTDVIWVPRVSRNV